MPPASGGRCGAQIPAAFAFARSSSISASDGLVLARERGLVRIDVLLHERAHLGAARGHLRLEREVGHQRESARVGAGKPGPERDLPRGRRRSGRSRPRTGRRRARETLEQGPFDYVAGGAGAEATVRANREAFERRRLRPRMLDRTRGARPLGRGARAALAGAVPARPGRRALDRASRGRARRRARLEGDRRADGPLERRVDAARGRRRGARRARSAGSSSTGGPTASSPAASSTAPARPGYGAIVVTLDTLTLGWRDRDLAQRLPPLPRRRRAGAVLQRPALPRAARRAAGGGPADGVADGAGGVPEPRASPGATSRGCASGPSCRSSSRACSRPRTPGSRSSTASTGSSSPTTAAGRSTARSPPSTRSSRCATRSARTRPC